MAIMAPRMRPSIVSIPASEIAVSIFESPVFITPITGFKIKHISIPSMNIPTSGYIRVGLRPSTVCGSLSHIL